MQKRMALLVGVTACGLTLTLAGVVLGQPAPAPEVSAATQKADPIVEETLQLLTEASSTLSRVDPALDRPMSSSERAAIQDRVDDARKDLSAPAYEPKSLSQSRALARESRDLAQEALESARDGKRERALQRLSRSIVKMQEAQHAVEPALTAEQRQGLVSKNMELPAGTTDEAKGRPIFTIRGRDGRGGRILLGPDGLRLEGVTSGEKGAITIGPGGVRMQGRDGKDRHSAEITREGVKVGGND